MCGKWHCGFLPDFSPTKSGWQEFFGNFAGGVDYFSHVSIDSARPDLYEGGIRVPQIVRWPGVIGQRQVTGVPMVAYDWFPTLLELAGTRPDPAHPTDGVSFAPYLLRGGDVPQRDLFWRMRGQGALRRGDYKYHSALNGGTVVESLFNIADDQREMANLATREPAVLADLKAAWQKVNTGLIPYA